MEAEIISWPSLWRADCAACFVARCRIPRPVRKLCGAGPRACTGGRHWAGATRKSWLLRFPFADIDLRLFGTATNAFSGRESLGFPQCAKFYYPFLSFAFKTELRIALGMGLPTDASGGPIPVVSACRFSAHRPMLQRPRGRRLLLGRRARRPGTVGSFRETLGFALMLAACLTVYFHETLLGDRILSPADVLLVEAS